TMIFELVTLRHPWLRDASGRAISCAEYSNPRDGTGNDSFAIMQRLAREPRPRASAYRSGVSERLEEGIARARGFRPHDRFGGVRELEAAIVPELSSLRDFSPAIASDTLPPVEATPILVPADPVDTAIRPRAWDPHEPTATDTRTDASQD